MKTRKTFDSVRGSSIRKLQGGMSLLAVFTLLFLGVLGSGCGGPGPGGWYGSQCSSAVAGANVSGGDFSGCSLIGDDLSETDFSYADFEGAELINAYFWIGTYGADLEETQFNNVLANSVDFTEAYLLKADFRPLPHIVGNTYGGYTDLEWAVFNSARLVETRMNGASLRGASFVGAILKCANLRGADLREVDFTGADMEGADLTDAVFDANTDFTNANVEDACFSTGHGADLNPAVNNSLTVTTPLNCVPSFP